MKPNVSSLFSCYILVLDFQHVKSRKLNMRNSCCKKEGNQDIYKATYDKKFGSLVCIIEISANLRYTMQLQYIRNMLKWNYNITDHDKISFYTTKLCTNCTKKWKQYTFIAQ